MADIASGESDLQAADRALVLALEQLLNRPGALTLQEVSLIHAGEQDIVISRLIGLPGADRKEILLGATSARGDPLGDSARATLDAV